MDKKKTMFDTVDKEFAFWMSLVIGCLAVLFLLFIAQSGWLLGTISYVIFVVLSFSGVYLISWLFQRLLEK